MTTTVSGRYAVADWIETQLLLSEERTIGTARLNEVAAGNINISPADIVWGFGQMKDRHDQIGDTYPFEVMDGYVKRARDLHKRTYVAMLLMSPKSFTRDILPFSDQEIKYYGDKFEELTAKLLEKYLGEDSKSLVFGAENDETRPSDFPGAVAWLGKKLNIDLGNGPIEKRRKDGGVDVVAWKPFPDKKPGMPVLLTQCTIGDEFLNKATDINLNNWNNWLSFPTPPQVILATPSQIPFGEKWDEITRNAWLFDRTRLSSCKLSTDEFESLDLEGTLEKRIEEIKVAAEDLE